MHKTNVFKEQTPDKKAHQVHQSSLWDVGLVEAQKRQSSSAHSAREPGLCVTRQMTAITMTHTHREQTCDTVHVVSPSL